MTPEGIYELTDLDTCSFSRKCLFLAAVLFLLVVVAAPSGLLAQAGYEVHSLEFDGNTTLSDAQLNSLLSTKATSGFKRKILGKDAFLFSEDILHSDLKRIERLYQKEGFLDVRVELANLGTNDNGRSVRILIRITEGTPIRVRRMQFSLQGVVADSIQPGAGDFSEALSGLRTQTSERFRDSLLYQDQEAIVRRLEDMGYPYAKAEPGLSVDRGSKEVDIDWHIDPGPICRFGDITVSGLQHAAQGLVRKPLTFKSGDIYSRTALEKSQRRIYGLSMFHVVTVKALLSSEQNSIVPVDVRIDEAPRLSSRIGVGYGREEKFRVYSDSRLLGFLGGARQLNLYLKHSDIEPYHVSLKLRQPAFLTSYTTLEISPFLLRQREPAFDQVRFGGHATLLHQIAAHLHGSVAYTFERIDLDTTSLGDLESYQSSLEDLYQKSGMVFGLTFDNSAPMFSPDRGTYAAGAFTISGLGLGSDFHYTRLLLDVRRYQKVLGVVVAGRVKAGGINSGDDPEFIPVEDRFYSGGSSSVRGWARAEIGPADDDGVPIGGNTLFESSLELRYPIYGLLSGVFLYDLGNVWAGTYSFHMDDLRYSAGLGLRVSTPIGPIRFDIAWPVADVDTGAQLHISVGEAF